MIFLSIKRAERGQLKRTGNGQRIRGALRTFALAGLLATTGTAAQAVSITVSDVISGGTASVQKFDTGLGTLNTVQIQYDISVGLSALFLNSSTTAGSVTVGNNLLRLNGRNWDIFDTSLPFGEMSSQPIGGDFPIAAAFTLPGGTVISQGTNVDLGFDYNQTIDSDGFGSSGFFSFNTNLFAGTGNFDFNFTAALDESLTFSGFQPFISPPPSVTGSVTVTYDYTEAVVAEIPAPAALPLLATGLAAFGLLARRGTQGRKV